MILPVTYCEIFDTEFSKPNQTYTKQQEISAQEMNNSYKEYDNFNIISKKKYIFLKKI